ncbi:hypothetical protein TNCV_4713431 [Trichonephila clavipes]|nr:hypothetical protein TNCV_4713431 [Trichonephila clavipes]
MPQTITEWALYPNSLGEWASLLEIAFSGGGYIFDALLTHFMAHEACGPRIIDMESVGWNGLRTELDFRFSSISDDSASGEESPIMRRKRSRALRGQETRDEREQRKGRAETRALKREREELQGRTMRGL